MAAILIAGLVAWGLLAPSSLLLACGVLAALSSFAILFERWDERGRRRPG